MRANRSTNLSQVEKKNGPIKRWPAVNMTNFLKNILRSFHNNALKVCLFNRCVLVKYPVPQHVLMAIWAY